MSSSSGSAVGSRRQQPRQPERPPRGDAPASLVLHLLFFVSGALGLVYEVLWIRQFTVVFGATTLATTATLSGFFLGIALGSAVFGARCRRWRRPLRAFGLLEIGVGVGALLVRPILDLYGHLYPTVYPFLAPYPLTFALVKLVLAMLAVAVPAFCMGGTLPTLGELLASSRSSLGIPAGGLYAVNVLGATAGALSVPFVLLPRLGMERSYFCAIGCSVAIGLLAALLGARDRDLVPPDPRALAGEPSHDRGVLALAFLSGATTLGVQVLWTRMFSLVHENSIYSFAVVVSIFLVGLSIGAALARLGLRRAHVPERLLAGAWVLGGVLVAVSPRLFHHLTGGFAYIEAHTWRTSLSQLLLLATLTMLPAAIALGVALPLLMELAGRRARGSPGPVLGRLLAVNTAGSIVGPLLVTFALAPRIGPWWSLAALGLIVALAGANLLSAPERAAAAMVLLVALGLAGPRGLPAARIGVGERLVSVREGAYGTTAVLADDEDRWITQNNSYVLGGAAAAGEERFQAHLPLLLHPAPRRVAFLGLGSGITAGAALQHPVESVVALEIVPEVVEAARDDFADVNGGLIDDPRVTIVADDGRNHLGARPHAFDVIVGDLLVPWRPAEAPLYAQEHFESVRNALAPDGIFCQWLPLYQLSEEQLAILVRTFVETFPRTTLWRGNFIPQEPTLALVGHTGTRPIDPAAVDRRVRVLPPSVAASNPFLADPAGLWLFLQGPVAADAPWLSGVRRNRDAEPWVEVLSARGPSRAGDSVPHEEVSPLLEAVSGASLAGTPLRDLDPVHVVWRKTGASLARASLDRGPTGEREVLAILQTLPSELRRSLGVD